MGRGPFISKIGGDKSSKTLNAPHQMCLKGAGLAQGPGTKVNVSKTARVLVPLHILPL